MTVRFASFNVENLFERPKAFNLTTWADGQPILDAYRDFNTLIEQAAYSQADKNQMIQLLLQLEVYRLDNGLVHRNRVPNPRWAWLRANRGSFDVDHEATGIEIVATGRADWIGWLELATEPVNEVATHMTARVINDVAADVLAVIEAEHRPSLQRFNEDLLSGQYRHTMLIDGNDTRGIDVGILTSNLIDIVEMRSNVDTPDPQAAGEKLFSRDCAEYHLQLPNNVSVWVLINHFKSQSGGSGGSKRARQAQEVRNIVDQHLADGDTNIVVMGDLNEGPDNLGELPPNLTPLFGVGSPLVDVYTLPDFDPGPRPGTFQACGIDDRFDYILLSPALAALVVNGGIERHGLWGNPANKNPPAHWEIYPEIKNSKQVASDHAAIFVDINI